MDTWFAVAATSVRSTMCDVDIGVFQNVRGSSQVRLHYIIIIVIDITRISKCDDIDIILVTFIVFIM